MRNNIVNIAKACLSFIDEETTTPQIIYSQLMMNPHLSNIKKMLTPKDALTVCFLAPMIHHGDYKEGSEYVIDNFLYSFSTVDFDDVKEEAECNSCSGTGTISCDHCYGDGYIPCSNCDETGEQKCDTCDGDGEDNDGNPCDDCQGSGETSCGDCDGNGTVDCDWCEASGTSTCEECNDGKIDTPAFTPFQVRDFYYWEPKYLNFLKEKFNKNKTIKMSHIPFDKIIYFDLHDYDHENSDTEEINDDFNNGMYVGGIIEKPDNLTYINKNIDSESPFDIDKFTTND